jgi:hypothetical protein
VACFSGTTFSVKARHFILAGGGIENARLLLLSNPGANPMSNPIPHHPDDAYEFNQDEGGLRPPPGLNAWQRAMNESPRKTIDIR